ncbi:MAG: transcription antitermination factor NusB [Ruminococcaceae bacterium]|nr:transcription antitermination factor NusB [Oscillospiraceae bacterium]MBQ9914074.1 transcription antitermination factor NusB [Clostridia bacterium]
MTRHEARELAFVLIFEKSFQEDVTIVELIENALELEVFPTNAFAENLAKKVYANLDEIDKLINENLVGWSAKRISRVSRAILRLAVCELLYSENMPVGVAINEAVEIAKKYATADDASYVNGVLGTIARKIKE